MMDAESRKIILGAWERLYKAPKPFCCNDNSMGFGCDHELAKLIDAVYFVQSILFVEGNKLPPKPLSAKAGSLVKCAKLDIDNNMALDTVYTCLGRNDTHIKIITAKGGEQWYTHDHFRDLFGPQGD